MLLTEYIQKRLREEAEGEDASPEEIREELKQDYPELMAHYEKNHTTLPKIAANVKEYIANMRNMEKTPKDIPTDSPLYNLTKELKRYLTGSKKEKPVLEKIINQEPLAPEWPLDENYETKLEHLNDFFKTFISGVPDKSEKEEWKEKLEMKYPFLAKLFSRRGEFQEKSKELKKQGIKKDPIVYLANETLGSEHDTEIPNDIYRSVRIFNEGVKHGPFALSKKQENKLDEEDKKLRSIFKKESNLIEFVDEITGEVSYERKHDLNPRTKAGGGSKDDFTDSYTQPEKEQAKQKRYNKPDYIDIEIERILSAYWKVHDGTPPATHKNPETGFESFYENIVNYIDAEAMYKQGIRPKNKDPLFANLSDENVEELKNDYLTKYWENNIKTQE